MNHFYQDIDGCFTWPEFYSKLIGELKPSLGVELGTFNGQSLAYFAVECINSGIDCKIDGVDVTNGNGIAARNLKSVRNIVRELRAGKSWQAAQFYEDGSLDFVFIDAAHDYQSVTKDIAAWKPKVRAGGIVCGHDYSQDYPGVVLAVTEAFESWNVSRGTKFTGSHFEPEGRNYYPVWSARI